jgi:HEAT repeats
VAESLQSLLQRWERWALTAEKDEDGWESSFPAWDPLMAAAKAAMSHLAENSVIPAIEKVWEISAEDEDLIEFARANLDGLMPTLARLARSQSPTVRWQIYEALRAGGPQAEPILREGMRDADPYARRRALLSLADSRPADAAELAHGLAKDGDPYIRQCAVEMALASDKKEARAAIYSILKDDPVPHVRRSAESLLS